MNTAQEVSSPYKATVHFFDYVSRKTNRDIQSTIAKHQGVDMSQVQNKFTAMADMKTDEERMKAMKEISPEEQKAIWDLQDVMVFSLIEKIVTDDGQVLDDSSFSGFFDRMKDDDFLKLSEVAGGIITQNRAKTEKKTDK